MKLNNTLVTPVLNEEIVGILEKGSEFEGKICFRGTMRMNGIFKGEVSTSDTLVLGEDACVEGKIEAGVVIISGKVKGRVIAKYRVEIKKPAVFLGEIVAPSLQVEEGVVFNAKSRVA